MNVYEINLGILIGGAAAALSIFAALTALYLWAVNRARQRLSDTATPQERAVLPWLTPLMLPTLIIIGLGIVANLAKAYEQRSWPEPGLGAMLLVFVFWLWMRKKSAAVLQPSRNRP